MRLSVILALGILLVGPAAGAPGIENPAGPVPARLDVHLSQVQDSILTPYPVPESVRHSLGGGVATHSACLPLPLQTFTQGQHHTWYAVLSTGDVQYDGTTPTVSSGQGPAADIAIDPDTPISFTWFLEVNARGGAVAEVPAAVPRVVVEARLREGDSISVAHRSLDAGRVVAQARSQPADLHPLMEGHPHVEHMVDDGRHIYAFRLVLEPQGETRIPREAGMHLRVDAYIDEPACQEGRLMPDLAHPYTAPGMRPGLDFAIDDPIRITHLAPRLQNGTLLVQADVKTPWGLLDVRPGTIEVGVAGPGELAQGALAIRSGSRLLSEESNDTLHCRCYPDDRVEVHQAWDLSGAADGTYAVHVNATNLAGTATARAETRFDLPGGEATVCRASEERAFCQHLSRAPEGEAAPALPALWLLPAWAILHRMRSHGHGTAGPAAPARA